MGTDARGLVGRAVKSSAAAVDRVRAPRPGVVVLIYHRVGAGSGLELDLPTAVFDAQVRELAASGRVVTLDDALDRLADPTATGPDPVVLTFDDGPADFVDTTMPILAAHGVPATMYVATAFVEEQRPFPYGAPPLSWGGLRDGLSTGLLTVGSHTHTHALLDRLDAAGVATELDTSVGLVEDRLGVTPVHFAYPKSVPPTSAADAAVRTRFRSAALAGTRPNPFGTTDPFRLARSPIQAGDGMRWFRAKADGGLRFEDDLRRVVNRFRYAGADS